MNATLDLRTIRLAMTGLVLVALGACGIDQGGSPASTPEPQAGAQVIYGPITGFGSVLINDLTVESSSATILVDGLPAVEADLREGQIVRIASLTENDRNTAVLIEYQENVSGPIDDIRIGSNNFTVLRQEIQTDANTRFDIPGASSLSDLQLNDAVQVSAFRDPSGTLLATYVGRVDATDPFEVSTAITAVDSGAQTFSIGSLVVDYSQAQLLELPSGEPEIGLVVEVEGAGLNGAGALVADRITTLLSDPGLFSSIDTDVNNASLAMATSSDISDLSANFAGFILGTSLPGTITVGDLEIRLPDGAVIQGGDAGDLRPGRLVRIVGQVVSPGVIEARRITIL